MYELTGGFTGRWAVMAMVLALALTLTVDMDVVELKRSEEARGMTANGPVFRQMKCDQNSNDDDLESGR